MKKRLIISLLFSTIFMQFGFSQMRENLQEEIDKIIFHDTEITFNKIPGFVIGIIYRDSVFIYNYGSTTKDSLNSPNKETIFEIGGLTKVFTASLVNLLVDEEIMNYDSSFNHYLPLEYQNEMAAHITINDLVIHTSGLPKLPLEFGVKENETNNPYALYTKEDLLNFYKNYTPIVGNSGKYHYSTLNYALLEVAIEYATRQSFETVLTEKNFHLLDMQNSCITIDEKQRKKLSCGYTVAGVETPIWQFQSFAASEGVK